MAPLSAYLFRLKPGYSIGTVRPKTMCRKLLRDSIEAQASVHAQDEEEVQTTAGAAAEGARMLCCMPEEDEEDPDRPPAAADQGVRLPLSLSERRGKKGAVKISLNKVPTAVCGHLINTNNSFASAMKRQSSDYTGVSTPLSLDSSTAGCRLKDWTQRCACCIGDVCVCVHIYVCCVCVCVWLSKW